MKENEIGNVPIRLILVTLQANVLRPSCIPLNTGYDIESSTDVIADTAVNMENAIK